MRYFLYPFSLIYYLITTIRNLFYDHGIIKSIKHKTPIICVGNLSMGGTGKTPLTDYITKTLLKSFKIAIISRGYGRKTSDFRYVDLNSSPLDVGDEPLMLKNKNPKAIVVVENNRNKAVKKIINDFPKINLIILDDGFQHRKIQAKNYILTTPFHNLYFNNNIFPLGTLRESKKGSKRADIIMVSNSPKKISETTRKNIIKYINPQKNQSIFFSSIEYLNYISLKDNSEVKKENFKNYCVTLVTAIASNKKILEHIKSNYNNIKILSFIDHHYFNENDVHKILTLHSKHKSRKKLILTTEKDATKLKKYISMFGDNKIYYINIKINIDQKEKFNKQLLDYGKQD
tara:strand:+ start:3351 stop:4385 length:1035 start_codon:yes stop_codon:yes gene_type:complete